LLPDPLTLTGKDAAPLQQFFDTSTVVATIHSSASILHCNTCAGLVPKKLNLTQRKQTT